MEGQKNGIKVVIMEDINGNIVDVRIDAEEVRLYQKPGYKGWANHKSCGVGSSEGTFSAVKKIFGENVRSDKPENMYKEARMKFWAYQQLRSSAMLWMY